ncbi:MULTISPECIES: aminopeptidase C [Hallella]|uniref:Aminopeptidase n=1 Tax=Hallella faecis TaxID=2841596 RepID=A0ABV1FR33_9BACT|nr:MULTISPECIES: C1 family peptidase [Hallella]MBP6273647.1 aminopeptidase [Prevotella sp.]MBS7398983.1 aminopeptidase [Prevotella sp.]MBU0290104.1 C1 family peptidase [Hallella faecis]MDR3999702.1 C1 family peptidase [Hallella sp.]MED9946209.1 C1 family peptidase [Hallella sp.]
MKKIILAAMAAMLTLNAGAAEKKDGEKANQPVFTTVKANPITSIKNQNRSGTCWDYSTLSFFEAELLRKTNKTFDLCEAFVANKTYMDRAIQVVRLHGDCQFAQGGSAYDPLFAIQHYGICPEDAMPRTGSLYGDTLFNFNEFFNVMSPYVAAVAKSNASKLSPAWKNGLQGILDSYLGKCPESFKYEGKTYTPKSFAAAIGLDSVACNEYVSFTSYTHHPFWTTFAVEVQDNWRNPLSWNVPIEDLGRIIDNAIMNGYTVAWGGDVSEEGFTRDGLAYMYDTKKLESLEGSDMARWLKLTNTQKKNLIDSLGVNVPEVTPTQKQRQERYDNWELTDDHGMLIYGIAKDQNGKEYYMVKNSWGETGKYKGTWYMTKNYIIANTMDYMVNKNAVPKDIRKKCGF